MRYGKNEKVKVNCRDARRLFASMGRPDADLPLRVQFDQHIETCSRCARDYRLARLSRAVLESAAVVEPVRPDSAFFVALRARIERGRTDEASAHWATGADDGWATILMLTTRQLIPAMALLLLMIIGATFVLGKSPSTTSQVATIPRERVLFGDMYDYPEPTSDDVLQTLVTLEEK